MSWFTANLPWVSSLLRDHLLLALPPIVLSILIAVPIGRLAYRRPRLGGLLLETSTLLYAVPSLPLLILIPAIIGTPLRSSATMIVALTVYGVALLVRFAADAFSSMEPAVRESAIAIGSQDYYSSEIIAEIYAQVPLTSSPSTPARFCNTWSRILTPEERTRSTRHSRMPFRRVCVSSTSLPPPIRTPTW